MDAVISQLISQLNSSVFILLGLFLIAGWTLFYIGKWLGKWGERLSGHKDQLDSLDQKAADTHDQLVELRTKIELIYMNTNPRSLVRSMSPLGLTPLGKQISSEIGASELFEKYKAKLFDLVNNRCEACANAYDIQVACIDITRNDLPKLLTAEELNSLKTFLFSNGFLLDDVMMVFGIYLRDAVLEARGIPVLDVDKHDPLNK